MSDFQTIFGDDGFGTDSVAPQEDYALLPPGKYVVSIDKSEVKQTKRMDGHYLELTMCVLEGKYRNRKLWDRINIDNPSQTCVQIGLSVLAAIGRALQLPKLLEAAQLVSGVLVAHVKVKGDQNEIRTYSSVASYREEQAKQPVEMAASAAGPVAGPVTQAPVARSAEEPAVQEHVLTAKVEPQPDDTQPCCTTDQVAKADSPAMPESDNIPPWLRNRS